MGKTEKPDADLAEKARELWGDPERELDEYDLELARLQAELDEEDSAKAAAAEKARLEAEAAAKARRKAAEADDEADDDEDVVVEGGDDDEDAEPLEDEDDEAPAAGRGAPAEPAEAESLASRGKRKLDAAADEAAREVAAEAIKSGNVKDAALTVVKRRLPGLPSREQFRNAALGVAGAGVGLWLVWGILAPIFGWAWWLAKWGIVGAAGYGAYRTYQMLPDRSGGGDEAKAPEAEDE